MPSIVQINFDYDVTEEELSALSNPDRAKVFHTVAGLRWKIWLRDADRRESGGIYLFEDRRSAQAYIDGPIVEMVKAIPHTSNHSIKLFEVREDVSMVTGAPLDHCMVRT